MRLSKLLPIAILINLIYSVCSAEPAMVSAWRGVVAHSSEYAGIEAAHGASEASHEMARAVWLPSIQAQGLTGRATVSSSITSAEFSAPTFGSSSGVSFSTNIVNGNHNQWAVTAEQPIWDSARTANHDAMTAKAQWIEAKYQWDRSQLMIKAAQELTAVIATAAAYNASKETRSAAMRARDTAKMQFESGDLPITEWREAQATADLLAVTELDASQAQALAIEAYSQLVGQVYQPADAIATANGMTQVGGLAAEAGVDMMPLGQWQAKARAHSPLLHLASEQLAMAEAEEKRYGANSSFKLSLVGQVGRDNLNGTGDFSEAQATTKTSGVGLQLTVPLFTGGMQSAQRHAAHAAAMVADKALLSTQKSIESSVHEAWLSVQTAQQKLKASETLQLSAQAQFEATRIGHEVGDRSVLDVLKAQAQVLDAAVKVKQAACQGLVAQLELLAVVGELSDESLRETAEQHTACR